MKFDPAKSCHLPILRDMFPNQVFLSVDEMAQILSVSKAQIYKMCEQKRVPFTLVKLTNKVQVSIVEMARYLDTKVQKEEPATVPVPDASTVVKRRRGRPIGSSKVVVPPVT